VFYQLGSKPENIHSYMPNANNDGIGDKQVQFIISITALPPKACIFRQVKKKKALPA
jgi:hypothetical protein